MANVMLHFATSDNCEKFENYLKTNLKVIPNIKMLFLNQCKE